GIRRKPPFVLSRKETPFVLTQEGTPFVLSSEKTPFVLSVAPQARSRSTPPSTPLRHAQGERKQGMAMTRTVAARRTWTQGGNAVSWPQMSVPHRSAQASALIVDDERDIRELLVLTLGRMGLKCDTASSLHD